MSFGQLKGGLSPFQVKNYTFHVAGSCKHLIAASEPDQVENRVLVHLVLATRLHSPMLSLLWVSLRKVKVVSVLETLDSVSFLIMIGLSHSPLALLEPRSNVTH